MRKILLGAAALVLTLAAAGTVSAGDFWPRYSGYGQRDHHHAGYRDDYYRGDYHRGGYRGDSCWREPPRYDPCYREPRWRDPCDRGPVFRPGWRW